MFKIEPNTASQQDDVVRNKLSDNSETITSMESIIKNSIEVVEKNKEEIKKIQGMIKDTLANDPTFVEHENAAKEAVKIKNATKAQVMKQPQVAALDKQLKELKSDNKQTQLSLFDYLGEYQRMSGVNEIETHSGEVMLIVNNSKLVKKSEFVK